MKWIVGSDHAGYQRKLVLCEYLRQLGDELVDVGTISEDSVDYADYAAIVAQRVVQTPGCLGLLVCGTGNGMAMAANKVAGVRAAVVTDAFTGAMARAHNDANIIAIGARVTGAGVAEQAVRAFRDARFEGGRHARRLSKVMSLEQPSSVPADEPDLGKD